MNRQQIERLMAGEKMVRAWSDLTNSLGGPIDPRNLLRITSDYYTQLPPNICFHDLRHTAAS